MRTKLNSKNIIWEKKTALFIVKYYLNWWGEAPILIVRILFELMSKIDFNSKIQVELM